MALVAFPHQTIFHLWDSLPVVPNIDGVGTNWDKFVSRAVLGGLLNIVPALLVGWLIVEVLAIRSRKHINC